MDERLSSAHELELDEVHFINMRSGSKTVEGRKRSETWKSVEVGDLFHVVPKPPSKEKPYYVRVTFIHEYDGKDPLFSYLMREGLDNTLPGTETLTEAIAIYLQYWKVAEIKKLGIFAFGIELVK